MDIRKNFYNNVVHKCGVEKGDRILLGISGGPDSLCLFDLFFFYRERLGISLGVAHVHHGLRGEDSDHDAVFVKELAAKYGVPFFGLKEDVGKIAVEAGLSLEEAGRMVRYNFFKEVMEESGFNLIAVGHHEKDQSETVLLHLIRGSGLRGLSGMRFRNGNCIRPLLSISREAIMDYVKEEELAYCVDGTNEEASFLRNKVRLHLLPELEKYNKRIVRHLFNLSQIAGEENAYIEKMVADLKERYVKVTAHGASFSWEVAGEEAILRKGLYQAVYYEVSGKSLYYDYVVKMDGYLNDRLERKRLGLPGNVVLKKRRDGFFLELGDEVRVDPYQLVIHGEGDYPLPYGGVLTVREVTVGKEYRFGRPEEGFLFLKDVKWPLTIRNRQDGDAYAPFGRRRPVKVKELYIKKKVDRYKRDIFPQVVDREGEILFIPVLGINDAYRIGEEGEKVLYIHYQG